MQLLFKLVAALMAVSTEAVDLQTSNQAGGMTAAQGLQDILRCNAQKLARMTDGPIDCDCCDILYGDEPPKLAACTLVNLCFDA